MCPGTACLTRSPRSLPPLLARRNDTVLQTPFTATPRATLIEESEDWEMRSRALLLLLAASAVSLSFLAGGLYFGRDGLHRMSRAALEAYQSRGSKGVSSDLLDFSEISAQDKMPVLSIDAYLDAILDTKSTKVEIPNMRCPKLDRARYQSLIIARRKDATTRYYFALNVRQSLAVLPRLIGSIIEVIRFLGPRHCALSVVDGDSADGSDDILATLRPFFKGQGVNYTLTSLPFEPGAGNRTAQLAEMRNEALRPLHLDSGRVHDKATVVFLDDVAPCAEDILELILQRESLHADMTCGMDWLQGNGGLTFKDVWTARDMNGDYFYDATSTEKDSKVTATLFDNAKETRARFLAGRPFQVFSCWNGGAAFAAKHVLDGLTFRAAKEASDGCENNETHSFCKDLWSKGNGKIAVVPTVNLGHSIDKGGKIKEARGYVSDLLTKQDNNDDSITWEGMPPTKIKCMPSEKRRLW